MTNKDHSPSKKSFTSKFDHLSFSNIEISDFHFRHIVHRIFNKPFNVQRLALTILIVKSLTQGVKLLKTVIPR